MGGLSLAQLTSVDGILVEQIYDGYPAHKSGAIFYGDVISTIDGLRFETLAEAVQRTRTENDVVELFITRNEAALLLESVNAYEQAMRNRSAGAPSIETQPTCYPQLALTRDVTEPLVHTSRA